MRTPFYGAAARLRFRATKNQSRTAAASKRKAQRAIMSWPSRSDIRPPRFFALATRCRSGCRVQLADKNRRHGALPLCFELRDASRSGPSATLGNAIPRNNLITGGAHPRCCPLTYVPALGTGPTRESPRTPSRYRTPIRPFALLPCRSGTLRRIGRAVAGRVSSSLDSGCDSLRVRTQ